MGGSKIDHLLEPMPLALSLAKGMYLRPIEDLLSDGHKDLAMVSSHILPV